MAGKRKVMEPETLPPWELIPDGKSVFAEDSLDMLARAADLVDSSLDSLRFELLPWLIYFPTNNVNLPHGKLWGILMELGVTMVNNRRNITSSVFILADQHNSPHGATREWMINAAMDDKQCPVALRYDSLSYALRHLCGGEGAKYHTRSSRHNVYFLAGKSWRCDVTDKPLDYYLKGNPVFIDAVPDLHSVPFGNTKANRYSSRKNQSSDKGTKKRKAIPE